LSARTERHAIVHVSLLKKVYMCPTTRQAPTKATIPIESKQT
jgi:hypothetical protein